MTTRTLTFRRTEYEGKTDQLIQVGTHWLDGISLCGFGVDKLWDLPAGTKKVWVTATTERPEHGQFYTLRRNGFGRFTSPHGITHKAQNYLQKYFPVAGRVYIVLEHEE